MICPCDTRKAYADCCSRFHRGLAIAATAEELMKSRYSAFAVKDEKYLLKTWHPDFRPSELNLAHDPTHWLSLEILSKSGGEELDDSGTVEFVATSQRDGRIAKLHELSEFVREKGQWVYVQAK